MSDRPQTDDPRATPRVEIQFGGHYDDEERVSRTQRKAEVDHLKNFGRELVNMTPGKFAKLELPPELKRALELARRIQSAPARNREVQGLGRLMVSMPEFDEPALRAQIIAIDHGTAESATVPELTETERLAFDLLARGDEAIFALGEKYSRDELQTLRQIVRQAQKKLRAGSKQSAAAKDVAAWLTRPS